MSDRNQCPKCGTVKSLTVCVASGRGVAERWGKQYGSGAEWKDTTLGSSKDKYDKLLALGDNPDIEAVAEIIGNKSWSFLSCDGCGAHVKRAAAFQPYSDEILICEDCLNDGRAALSQDTEK